MADKGQEKARKAQKAAKKDSSGYTDDSATTGCQCSYCLQKRENEKTLSSENQDSGVVGLRKKIIPNKTPQFTNLQKMKKEYVGEETGAVWGTKVKYLDKEEKQKYQLHIKEGQLFDAEGMLFDTSTASSAFGGEGNAIFVMDEHGRIYASTVHSPGKFHHSSFLSGKPVASAGEIIVKDGVLQAVSRRSGHYKPTASQLGQFLEKLQIQNVNLNEVDIGAGFDEDKY